MPEEKEDGFRWKGWRWALAGFALSIAHAALWAVVWNIVTSLFKRVGW